MDRRPLARGARATLFLLPAGMLLGLFVVWPMLRALLWSLTDADLLRPGDAQWIFWRNYGGLLADPRFLRSILNTARFALLVVPFQCALAFVLALWVNRPERCWRWLRIVFFAPVVVSMPVLAVLWTMLYQPARGAEMGLVNAVARLFGFEPQAWLEDPRLAMPAIAAMSIWQGVGLQTMVFLAGLQGIAREQVEAATIDGAHAGQRLVHVIMPAMRNSIAFVFTVTLILAFRLFVQPYLMTRGGPEDSTLSMIQMIYETTFLNRELGYACAAAVLFLVLVAVLAIVQRRVVREDRA